MSYRFGDLKFIVRHETDGYIDTDTRMSSKPKNPTRDSLSSMLGGLSASTAYRHPKIIPAGSNLVTKEKGEVVPLESTLEIAEIFCSAVVY